MPFLTVTRDSGVAILSLDVPDAPVNTLSLALAEELRVVFDTLERDSSISAAVLISGKSDNFIAGADIEQFLEFKTAEEVSQWLLTEKLISTVPWDDAGPYLRFSVTFVVKTFADESRVMSEIERRLGEVKFEFGP